jgi:hypothetical protein
MNRRKYLAAVGIATTSVLAGCSGEEGTGTNTSGGTEAGGGTETDPATEANEDVATDAQTDTAEPTAADDQTVADTEATDTESDTETEADPATETATTSASGGFSQTFSGSGTSAEEGLELSPGPILAEFSHSGASNFIVTLVTVQGESYEDVYLTNEIGETEGSQAATVTADGEYNLDVDADGDWEISLEQPTNPQPKPLPVDESGDGPSYIGPYEFSGTTTFQGSHEGESNFIVDSVPVNPSSMGAPGIFNEIGQFEGESTGRVDGLSYLNIMADGSWTLSTG